MLLAVASDHAGLDMRLALRALLLGARHEVVDLGTDAAGPVDYSDVAVRCADAVVGGEAPLGILICGTGLGMSIAANRVPGARAALCTHAVMATLARTHNHANLLCLGSRIVGIALAEAICHAFIAATPEGGRHARRVDKLTALEARPR